MATDTPVDKASLGDTSIYIRTYAKDMAALAGSNAAGTASSTKPSKKKDKDKPVVQSSQPVIRLQPQAVKPPLKEKESVVVTEPEEPFFSKQVPRAEREEKYQEPVALPTRSELDSIFERAPQAVPREESGPIPLMRKQQESVTPQPVPEVEVAKKRDSILSRLRAKVSKDSQMDIQPLSRPGTPSISAAQMDAIPFVEEEPPMQVLSSEPSIEIAPIAPMAPVPSVVIAPPVIEPTPAPVIPEPIPMPIPEPIPEPLPVPVPEPMPVIPEPEPIPVAPPVVIEPVAPAPVIEEAPSYREAIPEPVSEPVFVPPPTPLPVREPVIPSSDVPSPLHTYSTDFAGRIDERQASTFAVLAAQADAGQLQTRTSTVSRKKFAWVPVAAGILLLVVGGSGLAFAYQYVAKLHTVPIAAPTAPSLIFVDNRMELHGTGSELMNALAAAANNPIPDGTVLLTYVTQATTTPKGIASFIPAPGGSLISALQIPAPDILLRNIDPASTVGIIHAGSETKPFFILRVASYERTFAGMLTWEPVMWRDLAVLYPRYAPVTPTVPVVPTFTAASTTASTTAATSTPVIVPVAVQGVARAVFEDAVVASHDVRILHDTNGQTLLVYGYYDKQTLIIARDEAAFTTLINRLSATTVQ